MCSCVCIQECEDSEGKTLLCWLPNKFSKVVWAQRGDYLIVAPSKEEEGSGKVSATIVQILFPEQVDHLRALPCWPEGFKKESAKATNQEGEEDHGESSSNRRRRADVEQDEQEGSEEESDDDDDDLFVNSNRVADDSFDEGEDTEDEDDEDS